MEAALKREVIVNKVSCRIIGVFVFIILTIFGAFVRIPLPFSPVPITLQTLFVLLAGALLGGNLAALSQFSYILLGLLGLPIFTGAGSGLSYLLGPTGGYLFGFILAVIFIGRFIKYAQNNLSRTFSSGEVFQKHRKARDLFSVFVVLWLGDLIILCSGILWLKILLGYPLTRLLWVGFIPFIPGDLLKALIASILYLRLKTHIKEIL